MAAVLIPVNCPFTVCIHAPLNSRLLWSEAALSWGAPANNMVAKSVAIIISLFISCYCFRAKLVKTHVITAV